MSSKLCFRRNPPLVQRFLEAQARTISAVLVQRLPQVRFSLPDRVVGEAGRYGEPWLITVPTEDREANMAGGLIDRLTRTRPACGNPPEAVRA